MNVKRFVAVIAVAGLFSAWLAPARASDAPAPAPAAKPADGHGGGGDAHADKPKRTFEGQEPLFYLDSKRRPYIEPFQKKDDEEYFICRGTIGEWYRKLMAEEATMLAAMDNLPGVSGSTCALRLVNTHTGKKLPIVSVELYVNSDVMRSCILGETCPQARTVIMYVKDRTLYRSYIINDHKRRLLREYCLDNKSNILATQSCWAHFGQTSSGGSSGGHH